MVDQNKVDTCLCVLRSWCRAVKIPIELQYPQIWLYDCNNHKVPIEFTQNLVDGLLSNELEIALDTFHGITQSLGYGTPSPVRRGLNPSTRQNISDAFELITFRHREFRFAPDPDPNEMNVFLPVGRELCKYFFKKYNKTLGSYGLEFDDILSYVKIWTINFLHKYQKLNQSVTSNKKLLNAHLQQRFKNLLNIIVKKSFRDRILQNHVSHDNDIKSFTYHPYFPHTEEGPVKTDAEWEPLTNKNKDKRRTFARHLLLDKLGKMQHSQMLETLQTYSKNMFIHPAAREYAQKLLILHTKTCTLCPKGFKIGE